MAPLLRSETSPRLTHKGHKDPKDHKGFVIFVFFVVFVSEREAVLASAASDSRASTG
jgi:hypothetical protein